MINLQKGQRIDIGLSKVCVGLGWEPNEGSGADFDLDASAFMLNAQKIKISIMKNNEAIRRKELHNAINHISLKALEFTVSNNIVCFKLKIC